MEMSFDVNLNPNLRCAGDPQPGEYVPARTQIFYELEVAKSKISNQIGLGVFTKRNIRRGSIIMIGGGQLTSDAGKLPKNKDYAGVFCDRYLMAPLDFDNPSPNWLMNHSCEPNVKIIGGLIVIARCDLHGDDELTVDYSIITAGDFKFHMKCKCGSALCRKIITNSDWQDKELFSKYYEEWAPFIQKRGSSREECHLIK